MRVVGVHGVHNYQSGLDVDAAADALAGAWSTQILAGFQGPPPRLDVRFAYYADLLRGVVAQSAGHVERLPEEAQEALLAWAQLHDPPRAVAHGRGTAPLRALVGWIAQQYGLDQTLTRAFLSRFFGELTTYLSASDAPHRAAAQDRVIAAIERHEPRVVVAHSLGSVVTYEALWRRADLSVELLVTLGSPLAMPGAVFDKLVPDKASRPPGVQRWVNIADPGDIVAIPRPLSDRLRGVAADLETTIHWGDFHLSGNYLRSAALAATLAPFC